MAESWLVLLLMPPSVEACRSARFRSRSALSPARCFLDVSSSNSNRVLSSSSPLSSSSSSSPPPRSALLAAPDFLSHGWLRPCFVRAELALRIPCRLPPPPPVAPELEVGCCCCCCLLPTAAAAAAAAKSSSSSFSSWLRTRPCCPQLARSLRASASAAANSSSARRHDSPVSADRMVICPSSSGPAWVPALAFDGARGTLRLALVGVGAFSARWRWAAAAVADSVDATPWRRAACCCCCC
mmetsp:Transcript_15989/g.38207  ORF Transcript_15989/g.38207 Transcript_15989/m.38207 type:complete len:241 (-) Transcript_15989:129-851(-)